MGQKQHGRTLIYRVLAEGCAPVEAGYKGEVALVPGPNKRSRQGRLEPRTSRSYGAADWN